MAADVFLRRILLPQPLHIHLFPHSDKEDDSVYIHQWRYVIFCKFRLTSSKETEPRCKSSTPVFMILIRKNETTLDWSRGMTPYLFSK